MRTVLVTAAGGNAGRNTVESLLDKGFNVVATARDPQNMTLFKDVETRAYDANTTMDFDTLLKGIDSVVLIGPPLDGEVHKKLGAIIDAAAHHDIDHLAYISGNYLAAFSGQSLADLPIRKVELQIINSGLKHTFVRAGFFMDNFITGFNAPMVERGNITLATGNAKSSFVAASDVGAFIAESLARELTGKYLVTGPEALDHWEVAHLLTEKMGRAVSYTPISEEDLIAAYKSRGLPPETIEYGLTLYRAFRNHATAAVSDSIKKITGRDPISFKQFLKRV
ncbi:NmrA family NAD(P)-binding protein [Paraburkholderia terrae]|uniref:NmrA family NAD(P)-binding protein n=1 Tax=Paraburkholderia terrae TaxID=311230 RepID=UPI001EE20D4A|nr:NmrA family NAD(P)-binding protein [Paraburkholderia terrae]GJH05921.1 SDR family oxidoreductase [Paraburkholderia terrae]